MRQVQNDSTSKGLLQSASQVANTKKTKTLTTSKKLGSVGNSSRKTTKPANSQRQGTAKKPPQFQPQLILSNPK